MIKNIVIGVLAVLTLLFIGLRLSDSASTSYGASTGPQHYQMETFKQGLQIGDRGTEQKFAYNVNCNLSTGASFAASTTQQFYCTVPGVASGDLVMADLPVGAGVNGSGAGSIYDGFIVVAAYATTTNQVGVTLLNQTGAATSSYAQATTSVEIRVVR